MKKSLTAVLSSLFLGLYSYSENIFVPFTKAHWTLQGKSEIVEFDNRTALTGSALLNDVELLNGTIEVDIYTTGQRNFGGITFRVQSQREYEWCWFRIHKSNGAVQDGLQYAPIFNGNSCWQLFGGEGGIQPVDLPKNRWVHLKIEIMNETAKLYVGDMSDPVMVIRDLQVGLKKGGIGLRANRTGSIYFSNFSYKVDHTETKPIPPRAIDPTIIANWVLSNKYSVEEFSDIKEYPKDQLENEDNWIEPELGSTGLVNITKYHYHKAGMPPSCAILKSELFSKESKTVQMNFGYSDAVAIFLNEQPLFWGNNAWRGRNMADGGWIGYNDAVFLNLAKGRNELVVVVAEVFGGWGFQGNIEGYSNIKNGFNRN